MKRIKSICTFNAFMNMIDTLILSFGRRVLNFLVTKIVIGTSVILLAALINLNDEQNFTIVILRF